MRSLLVLILLALAGCDSCNETVKDGPRVPFKLDNANDKTAAKRDAGVKAVEPKGPHAQRHDPAIDKLTIDQAELSLSKMIASLAIDVDADGDRDVMAVRREDGKAPEFLLVERGEKTFEPAKLVAELSADEGCEPSVLGLSALSATKALIEIQETCAQAKTRLQKLSLFSVESAPRKLEVFVSVSEDSGRSMVLTPESRDVDDDGHDDVTLRVALADQGLSETATAALSFLDRPFGLTRDVREPETDFAALATLAHDNARKTPDKALSSARALLSLHRALCAEPRRSLLRVGGRHGIECKVEPLVARALAGSVIASVALKDTKSAVDGYLELTRVPGGAAQKALKEAVTALTAMKPVEGVTMKAGPEVSAVKSPHVTLPSARFVTDGLLYLRRDAPVVYDLARATETPAPEADDRIRDPQGAWFVRGVRRTCNALVIEAQRIDAAADPTSPATLRSYPLLSFTKDPVCRETSARAEDGGYRVLGWAPQGVLAAKGSEVRLVPVSADGNALGEPRVLAADAPRPAPIALGAATGDASAYVLALPFGVVIYGPKGAELLRPAGYQDLAPSVTEASLSPSASRVALVASGRVHLVERAAPAAQTP